MNDLLALFEKIGGAFGPSGREEAVREAIAAEAAPYIDEITTDALGNLICRKKGSGKKIMLAAHMDSIGMVVTHIDDKGFLRFSAVGGLFWGTLLQTQVIFANGTRGVISYEEKPAFRELSLDKLFIDIGASSKEQAEKLVQVGDFAVFAGERFAQNDKLCGPYLDDRIGCITLLLAMRELSDTENDLYFVFTVQEEVGLRGAGAATYGILPDLAVAVDVTDTGDLPERKTPLALTLGGGPAVKLMDRAVICSAAVRDGLLQTAQSLGMTVQREILPFGGTDTAAIQRTQTGVPAGAVSIPTRYLHSHCEMCDARDVRQAARLLAAYLTNA